MALVSRHYLELQGWVQSLTGIHTKLNRDPAEHYGTAMPQPQPWHVVFKYYQSTRKAHAELPQDLMVPS